MADSKIKELNNVLAFVEILECTADKVLKQISSVENEHIMPTLFLPSARSFRATRNRELTEIGAAYAAQAAALKSIEERIAKQRNKLDQLSAQHRNATCPIGSMPMEVLHQILLFAAGSTPRKLIPVIPLVCQFWNKALACLHVVWNNCGSRSGDLDSLTMPLTRAGPKANVTISSNDVPQWLGEPNLRAKVSTLTLSTLSPVSDLEVFSDFTLPNLVTLALQRTQQSSEPPCTGDITLPAHTTPRLRRLIIDSVPFNFIRMSHICCSRSTIETIELQNAPIYLPYFYKSLEAFRKMRQLRLIKVTEGDPLEEVIDGLDAELPDTLEIVTIHQCDWDTTRSFFEAPSFAKLRELRLAFPSFDSDPILDFAHRETHLSNVPIGELSSAASCCLSLSEALSEMPGLKLFCITSPDGVLRRVIRSLMEDDRGGPLTIHKLPNLTHFEIKVSNGHPCQPLGLHPMYHCMCSLHGTSLLDDIVKVLDERVADGKPLNVLKISKCLVQDHNQMARMAQKLGYFKCRCMSSDTDS